MLSLLVAFALVVNTIRFGAAYYWLKQNARDGSPRGPVPAWIVGLLLISAALVCCAVWFAKRRIELDFEEPSSILLVRTRTLFRARLRRLGLAGFSHPKQERIGPRWLGGALRLVIEFSDGRTEPVVDLPLWGTEKEADRILDAVFAMARGAPQRPTSVSIAQQMSDPEVKGDVLIHELVVDGKQFPAWEFGPLDLAEVGRSTEADGVYFIWTCTCGAPGCAGRFLGVLVEHANNLVKWSDRDMHRCFTFRLNELRRAFDEAIQKGSELLARRTGLTIIPEQNAAIFDVAAKSS